MFRPAQAETSDPYFEYAASLPPTRSLRRGGGLLGSPRSGAPRNRAARASTGAADRGVMRLRSVAQHFAGGPAARGSPSVPTTSSTRAAPSEAIRDGSPSRMSTAAVGR